MKYCQSCNVFDCYDNGPYVKDHEHKRRTGKTSAFVNLENLDMIPTFNQEVFLRNDQFISFDYQMSWEEKVTMFKTVWEMRTQKLFQLHLSMQKMPTKMWLSWQLTLMSWFYWCFIGKMVWTSTCSQTSQATKRQSKCGKLSKIWLSQLEMSLLVISYSFMPGQDVIPPLYCTDRVNMILLFLNA